MRTINLSSIHKTNSEEIIWGTLLNELLAVRDLLFKLVYFIKCLLTNIFSHSICTFGIFPRLKSYVLVTYKKSIYIL